MRSGRVIDPYDELPYPSRPVEWSAPERLTLCSMLHGGPRPRLAGYRVLELGCGDGANLLPLACYRPQSTFVGVDRSRRAVALAESRRTECQLHNVSFLCADIQKAQLQHHEPFDFILAHGVFSWVPDSVRDDLLRLCVDRLVPGGVIYMNYNCRPGWNVRGMVRDFLLGYAPVQESLAARARLAQDAAASLAASLREVDHPYARLLEREFLHVCQSDPSYVAHEFLAPENHAYWRSEFLRLVEAQGLRYVADADFYRASGRIAEGLPKRIDACGLAGRSLEDTVDLLCYRQLHSPVLTHRFPEADPIRDDEFACLLLASPLQPVQVDGSAPWYFRHASGHEVQVKEPSMRDALQRLAACWPASIRGEHLFNDVAPWMDDLRLLHRHGMIELRAVEPENLLVDERMSAAEHRWGGYHTTPLHVCEG